MENEGCERIGDLALIEAGENDEAEEEGGDGSQDDHEIHVVEDETRRVPGKWTNGSLLNTPT